ncbi:MAG: VIT domain-containing protein, partial [Planctomycetota bacterium]|nr:VIT domain-containing protein [Planctomycetota bacterium]
MGGNGGWGRGEWSRWRPPRRWCSPWESSSSRASGESPARWRRCRRVTHRPTIPRRLALSDGSTMYVDAGTSLQVTGRRSVKLSAGRVYVEVAPDRENPLTLQTPDRTVTALGTRLAVEVAGGKTGVWVTQGKVAVDGVSAPLYAGEQLLPSASAATAMPRATAVLPATRNAGGALTVVGGDGQEFRLELRKFHVDVHIEDGCARTTIDQTYFKHTSQRLEGTFYFPLPADASLSRLAMYVAGTRMEGGMVEREEARGIFESIVRRMKDPALLEWVDGTTFKMRVFPLEGRQEKRIILSYTQKLASLYDKKAYRFPAGHSLGKVAD